jgi:hypothetical protein
MNFSPQFNGAVPRLGTVMQDSPSTAEKRRADGVGSLQYYIRPNKFSGKPAIEPVFAPRTGLYR